MSPTPRYNIIIDDDDDQMIEWKSDLATDQQRSVLVTFNTLFDQLERDFPEAYNVLRILSFFDAEDIPLAMLTDGARVSSDQSLPGNSPDGSSLISKIAKWTHIRRSSRHASNTPKPIPLLPELRSLILSPTAFPKALHKLQSVSLVETLSRDGKSSLRMHDLVHSITREHLKRQTGYQAWLESAVTLVCGVLERVELPDLPRSWPEYENLMPHVRSLSKVWTGVEGVNSELVYADVRLAQYLDSRGRYDDAERLCKRSAGILQKELGEKHRDTLVALYVLAQIYRNLGRLTDAEGVLKHILSARKKVLGVHHEDTLYTMNKLANVYRRQGRDKEAEKLYKQVLAVREKTLGPDHLDTLQTMNNLALVCYSQKRYDEAVELHKHVLARTEKTLGPDHIDTLTSAHNLAHVYQSQRKFFDAEELFKRALVGLEKQIGPSHPVTLTTVMGLAILYHSQGRNDEAEPLFLRAFTGMKQHLGANHPDTLWCAKTFSGFYRSLGRDGEAKALLGQ
jgi:tetratricopeptide (TPR) repeat protein